MRTKLLNFHDLEKYLGTESYEISDNSRQMRRMSSAVRLAINCELTNRQQTCITLYYFERESIPVIARKLGINKSTVSRHLTKGRNTIKKVVSYACAESLSSAL